MTQELLQHREGAILRLTLNRPEALNALSLDLRRTLAEAVMAADADPEVRVVVLTGAGGRAFCAGLDMKEFGRVAGVLHTSEGTDPVIAMARCRKPIVGAVNGMALTGGFELALACDVLIASPAARFADTHMRVGVIPGWGLSQKLSRTIGLARAKSLSLTGRFLDAETALAWGVVSALVPGETLLDEASALAREIAEHDPAMIAQYKALIDEGFALSFEDAIELETKTAHAANGKFTRPNMMALREEVRDRNRAAAAQGQSGPPLHRQ